MSAFEHVTALLSFVYALALTHLLARIAELIVARASKIFRVARAWDGERHSAGICELVGTLGSPLSDELGSCLRSDSVFVCCFRLLGLALVGPKVPDEGVLDLEVFFWRQRIYFYGAIMVCLVLALLANLDFLKTSNTALFLKENLGTIVISVPSVAGLISRNYAVQWVAGICLLALIIGFAIMFSSQLG